MIARIAYCEKCGNQGKLIDGTPCDCVLSEDEFQEDVACLEIPEGYRGLKFNADLLPANMGTAYQAFMNSVQEELTSMRWKCKNMVLCAPQQSGKSVLAYTVLQTLFRRNIDVFPIYDVLEIKKIMMDLEYNKSVSLGGIPPTKILEVPYLFAYIPAFLNYDVFDTCNMLISRRVRRGHSTVLLYGGYWGALEAADTKKSLVGMKGDGSLSTVVVSSWSVKE